MSFPLSQPVNVGDPTEASQYNNLRMDALYLGGDPAASGSLLQLLYQSMGSISLTRVSGTTIRLNAAAAAPCALMIGGTICAVTSDLTLTLTNTALPAAGRYNLYAVAQSDGTFILDAGTETPTAGRMIGTFLWDGSGVIPGTLHNAAEYDAIRSIVKPSIANGRLTLAAGTPVPDADISAADTLYFTPYNGNEIALYTGGEWEVFSFTELSLSLASLSNELPYDIFLSADASGLHLTAAAWGSASARLTALVYFDGVQVSTADYGKRYLGSIALNAAGKGEDTITGRLLWNENNRVERPLLSRLTSSVTLTAAMNSWVPYYHENAPEVRLLVPDPDTYFELTGVGISEEIGEADFTYGRGIAVGIGRDMAMTAPYDNNSSCVPVFTHSFGNTPMTVSIRNFDAGFRGYHRYTLAFFSNYTWRPGSLRAAFGEAPGLYGMIHG